MPAQPQDLAKRFLRKEYEKLSTRERRVLDAVLQRIAVSRDVGKEFEDLRTFGERVADKIASFGGSWPFILTCFAVLFSWIGVNTWLLGKAEAFDPYPYILLNLVLSMLAALQAPVIMMSQNRQATKDRLDASHDYEVNLKAEIEIRRLHDKIDDLQRVRWVELLGIQEEQMALLRELIASRR
jgi:uncharacterized membrane protein